MLHKRLLFISFLFKPASAIFLFQNISCYCLSAYHVAGMDMDMHFKTSHVIVYRCHVAVQMNNSIFQNISCYCLSQEPDRLQIFHYHFKTSHVIVYLYELPTRSCKTIFQNISCYCLSLFARFQLIILLHFKTSHVIVYPREYEKCGTVHGISKHLMLLFIWNSAIGSFVKFTISKHLMLLFIQYRKVAEHEYFIISKHLMLLFIELMRMKNENPNLFQNISCYCLSALGGC